MKVFVFHSSCFCVLAISLLTLGFAKSLSPHHHTWVGFGEREIGDQLLILDERSTNSTIPISKSLIFKYEDLVFTFANLTVSDGFDKVIHSYDSFLSQTEVQFINSTEAEAQISVYGFHRMPMKKQPGGVETRPKKIVFSNNKKH